jgi:hypothetical protein
MTLKNWLHMISVNGVPAFAGANLSTKHNVFAKGVTSEPSRTQAHRLSLEVIPAGSYFGAVFNRGATREDQEVFPFQLERIQLVHEHTLQH